MKGRLFFFIGIALITMTYGVPFAYVTNYGSDSISIFDLAINATIGYVDNAGLLGE
jgi:hypothetical protein